MKQIKKWWAVPLMAVLLLVSSFVHMTPGAFAQSTNKATLTVVGDTQRKVILRPKIINIQGKQTALDILKKEFGSKVVTEKYSWGEYIIAIDGLRTGDKDPRSYWSFEVNGIPASVGADSYQVQNGDVIAFRYIADWNQTPTVHDVDDNDAVVTGTAEAGSTVSVQAGSKTYKGTVKKDGTFSVAIPMQKAGVQVIVMATDKKGNASAKTVVTVQDKTAPAAPKVHAVGKRDKVVTGTAEAGSTVVVKAGNKTYKAAAKKDGTFAVTIPAQKEGTVLVVTATDKAGNTSPGRKVTVGS